MTTKVKVYANNPTAGGTDGAPVTAANPVHSGQLIVPADDDHATGEWITLALRCDTEYETVEDGGIHAEVVIDDDVSVDKWQLAHDPDDPADWGDPLEFDDQIGAVNVLFYVRARTAKGELPANDESVVLEATALIGAVGAGG